jgi:deoxyribonuclease V
MTNAPAVVEKLIEKPIHSWDLKSPEATVLQIRLARRVVRQTRINFEDIDTVAGVDIGYRNDIACAAVVVMNLTDLKIMEEAVAAEPVQFPYVPGLLSFREGPVIMEALGELKTPPDLLMIDGQGIAHPRRFGVASHIGVLLDMPTIGCAKTRLVGDYEPPQRSAGSTSFLTDAKETIGAVVCTRTGVKPVFVSIGHLMNLNDSIRVVLKSCRGYRLPEPLRRADHLSRKQI